jgi:CBS-domain-containing membrane protein
MSRWDIRKHQVHQLVCAMIQSKRYNGVSTDHLIDQAYEIMDAIEEKIHIKSAEWHELHGFKTKVV